MGGAMNNNWNLSKMAGKKEGAPRAAKSDKKARRRRV